MSSRLTALNTGFLCLALGLVACSREKFSELVDKTKQKVSAGADRFKQGVNTATDTAKERLNLAGNAIIQLDSPVDTASCYATLITLGDGRPNVLQMRSYSSPAQESFPSILLRAPVKAAGASELIGQVVPAQLFVQAAADSPVWYSGAGSHVQLKIVSADDKSLTAEILSGALLNTHKSGDQAVTGTLTAVWQ